ncbi:inorganic pyrophosphatase [Chlamydia pecorum]|uniref:Inorganic pyrophosphatase n=3 Tax=Chlamydia pecorum TaxID=85991 RepID=A0AA34RCD8_CHLPE|nr:inorganic pyrophosphatase [Chlamydia pecorum]AEB41141.1 inorganic pyrophosphatase [Chlamydia pecorum E58]AGW38279.1 inorganic pyrophosphatase [Chlamydia pecorum PV3056/3]AGW39204.1 inorganic pyrophosphatase [Chlamydia pecorum W73]AGW40130.1 inorganic pyrophosphatase [Chlamydia pecorum P787]ETF38497.1 inorganic pyrophosphatase [Chlamydia pecorum VR629]
MCKPPLNIVHPWHGPTLTQDNYETLCCYIEITPEDSVKFELDKATGLLKVDRPQKFSNLCPCLYGLLPQTYCGEASGKYSGEQIRRDNIQGDKDPLDVCVLTEKKINQGNILLQARPIGGLRIIDSGEADDKIIAVLEDDLVFSEVNDVSDCPGTVLDMIQHYFLTYKATPESLIRGEAAKIEIIGIYGKKEAQRVIELAHEDYLAYIGKEYSVTTS